MELIRNSPGKEHDSFSCWGLKLLCTFCCMKSNSSVVKTFIIKTQEVLQTPWCHFHQRSLNDVFCVFLLMFTWKVMKLVVSEKRDGERFSGLTSVGVMSDCRLQEVHKQFLRLMSELSVNLPAAHWRWHFETFLIRLFYLSNHFILLKYQQESGAAGLTV